MSLLTQPSIIKSIIRWFDAHVTEPIDPSKDPHRIDWVQSAPFFVMHLMCLGVLWVGWSATAVAVAVALYVVRMFAITTQILLTGRTYYYPKNQFDKD